MNELTDEALFDLSDEELEAAFKEAKAQELSPETEVEEVAEEEFTEEVEEEIDVDEEEEVEDLEQPDDQDSDNDTSLEDEEDESDDEDTEETDEDVSDENSDEEDAEPTEEDEESEDEEQPVQDEVLMFKANGQDYEFTTSEMREQFGKVFGQAMDYTKKMQAIKPHRKTIDAIEQAGLTGSDINLMIDVLKGDKDALTEVVKRTGVDALDLDTENSNYVAKDYGRNDTELAIKDIVDEISGDKEYSVTHNVLDKQWDDKSRDAFIEDPNMIKLLHVDVKTGMFDKVNPLAQKLKVYDGASKSDLDYYKMAAQQYFDNQAQQEAGVAAQEEARLAKEAKQQANAERVANVKAKQAKQVSTREASAKRKAAAPTKKGAGTKKVVDYLDDSDEAFEDWYGKLQDGM